MAAAALAAAEAAAAAGGAQTRAGPAAAAAAAAAGAGVGALGVGAAAGARSTDVVSSNEPVYCVCRQIGWGDMVSARGAQECALCWCVLICFESAPALVLGHHAWVEFSILWWGTRDATGRPWCVGVLSVGTIV